MSKVIAVHSYRGGTGKSHFTANLATAVAMQGYVSSLLTPTCPRRAFTTCFVSIRAAPKTLNHFLWAESQWKTPLTRSLAQSDLSGEGRIWLIPSSVKADDIARILKDSYDVKPSTTDCEAWPGTSSSITCSSIPTRVCRRRRSCPSRSLIWSYWFCAPTSRTIRARRSRWTWHAGSRCAICFSRSTKCSEAAHAGAEGQVEEL